MTQNYKVGDKVRILDASKIISGASRGLKDGGIYEVVELYKGREYDPIVKLDDGHKFGFMDGDHYYIEKVAEDVVKFKIGDKVRINALSRFEQDFIGQEGVVHRDKPDADGDISVQVGHRRLCYLPENLTLVSDKPTKNQRIKTLESEVAELKAKVDALEKAQKPTINIQGGVFKTPSDADVAEIASKLAKAIEGNRPKSANEQRKAIISEAKAFVEEYERACDSIVKYGGNTGNGLINRVSMRIKFEVNPEKRAVTALFYAKTDGTLRAKAIAKCAPDDVFNADIGKAIALGRALGLDVSKFEQAVKPTEVVVGHIVQFYSYSGRAFEPAKITKIDDCDGSIRAEGLGRSFYAPEKTNDRIIDDTEAQY